MDKRVYITIFKLEPPMCPVCRVPIKVRDIREYNENYFIIIGAECDESDFPNTADFSFVYSIKEDKVITGSEDTNISKARITHIIHLHETSNMEAIH